MEPKPNPEVIPLLLLGVGLAVGLSLAALLVSLARLKAVRVERGPRWPRARCIFLSVFGVAVLAIAVVWLLVPAQYRATAVLRISPVSQMIVYRIPENQTPRYEEFRNTEVSVVRSPAVLNRVLDRPEVRDTQWYKDESHRTQGLSGGMLEKLQAVLDVEPRPGTELIDISVSTSKPSDSRLLADAVINEYRLVKEDLDKASGVQVKETLMAEQSSLQNEIDGLIHMRFNEAAKLGTDAPEQLRSALTQRKSELESKISEKEREQELKQWEIAMLERAASRPAVTSTGPSTPEPIPLSQLKFDLARRGREIELLRKELNEQKGKVKEAGDVAMQIANYDEKIRWKREIYDLVRSRREQLTMEEKAPARVRVVALATEPAHAQDCRRPATLAILAAAGLLSMLLLAFRPCCPVTTTTAGNTPISPTP